MKKYWKALTNLVIALLILLAVIFLVPRLLVFFAPFVVGWIIAWIASPMVSFFEKKLKIRRKAGSAFVIIAVIALVVLVLYLIGSRLVQELIGFLGELPVLWENVAADFAGIGEKLGVIYNRLPADLRKNLSVAGSELGAFLKTAAGGIGTPTIAAVGSFARFLPGFLIGLIMALLSAYFFVAERDVIYDWFRRHSPESVRRHYVIIRDSLIRSVGGYLKAQLRIEIWMYLLLVIGLSVLQVSYTLLIALGIAFLDLLPFFGTGTVMVPWAIVRILSGDYKQAVGLFIIWGVGQLVRQVIQPKIVGDSIGVAPIPTLILLFLGYRFGGVVGMIVAVPIGITVYTIYKAGAFDTTIESVRILAGGINRFRRLEPEDLEKREERKASEEPEE